MMIITELQSFSEAHNILACEEASKPTQQNKIEVHKVLMRNDLYDYIIIIIFKLGFLRNRV